VKTPPPPPPCEISQEGVGLEEVRGRGLEVRCVSIMTYGGGWQSSHSNKFGI